MRTVFISYRQLGDVQRQRVRIFAEKLRVAGVSVILDQFHKDTNPAGPDEGWPKWSSDQAIHSQRVLIIGNRAWFRCFEGAEAPGIGLGAACEAGVVRQRLYDSAGKNEFARIVYFDDSDISNIPTDLKRYDRFHITRDFGTLVKWLGGSEPASATPNSRLLCSIPNNLPSLQPFFGREKELRTIHEALDSGTRTWGALVDGPGGMGKTSLAVRAAYDCPLEQFAQIIFVSVKARELDDDGERSVGNLLVPGFLEMLSEVARELGLTDFAKSPLDQRIHLLLDALRKTPVLLILDNLESLEKSDRDQLLTFVKRIPQGCKAILTSRRRIGSGSELVQLDILDRDAALATLAALGAHNRLLAKTSEAERLSLWTQTGGNPLLLRWVAGQLGRGNCRTIANALLYLSKCPKGNDPLDFIFGDLAKEFTPSEERVLAALTYFSLPASVPHISVVGGISEESGRIALDSLSNRSLVVPDQEEQHYVLVPMVAEFLRKHRPNVVLDTGQKLEENALKSIMTNGGVAHERFPKLDADWPVISAALPLVLRGSNEQLQSVCKALPHFLNFTGRWDEWLGLSLEAENKAVMVCDFSEAGRRIFDAGWIYHLRGQSAEVIVCANRAAVHWRKANCGSREQGMAIQLRGMGHQLAKDYSAAIAAHRESLELHQKLGVETEDVAIDLNWLAEAERLAGDFDAAERDYQEALRIAKIVKLHEAVASITGNLAELALNRKDWLIAEKLSREALVLDEEIGRQELIGLDCHRIAQALLPQSKATEARPYALRAVEIFAKTGLRDIESARLTLAECDGKVATQQK